MGGGRERTEMRGGRIGRWEVGVEGEREMERE